MLNKFSSECELRKHPNLAGKLKIELENMKENFMNEKRVSENLRKEVHGLQNLQESNKIIISEIDEKNCSLAQKIELATSEISELMVKNEKLEKILSVKSKDIIGLIGCIMSKDKLIEELNGVKNDYKTFQNEHKNCEEVWATAIPLKEDYNIVEKDLKKLIICENKELNVDRAELKLVLENGKENLNDLEEKQINKERELHCKNQLVIKQNMMLLEEKEVLLKQASNDNEALKKQVQDLETLLKESENIQKNYEYEKQATENLKKELNELESLHSCNLLTISELNEKNSTLMINLEEIKHELTLNIYKLDELRKVVSDDKEEIVNLNLELLSKDKIIEELNITVKEYNDFQFAHSNCNEIKEAVDSLINDFCRLEKNRNVLKNENEILKDDKTKLQLSYEKASNELKNLTNKLVEKEKELRTCFENQLADVKENTRMDNEEKSRSSEQRDIKCEELKKEKLLKKELKYVKKKWKHEKQATENLKKELNKLEILYSCNQSKISELNEKNSTLTKDFLKVKHESTHNYNIYIYKLDELRNVVSDDKEEIVNLNLELLSKDKIIEELNIVVNEYSDFKSDHSNCNEIKEAVNSLRNDLFMLEESRSVLRYENEILKGDKTKLQLSYEKATNELKNLANKLVVREKQLQTYYEDKLADIKENMILINEEKSKFLMQRVIKYEEVRKELLKTEKILKKELKYVKKKWKQEQLTTTQLKLIIKNLNLEICDLKKITYF